MSLVRNDDHLQPQNIQSFGKEKASHMDVKTRWNSLLKMLQRYINILLLFHISSLFLTFIMSGFRFYELRKEIKIAMVQLEREFEFSDDELEKIKELCEALTPIEMTVKLLCKEDADLLLAEKVTEFTSKKLRDQGSAVALALLEKFETLVKERRNAELVHLLKYLKSPDFLDQYQDQYGVKIRKPKIAALATSLLQRLYPQTREVTDDGDDEVEVAIGTDENGPEEKQMTLSEEFESFMKESEKDIDVEDEIGSQVVKKEMALFEATKKRPENLHTMIFLN